MSCPTTPEPKPKPKPRPCNLEPPSTPGVDMTPNRGLPLSAPGVPSTPGSTMRIQRKTPLPSTPCGRRRMASLPRTPGSSVLPCSSSPTSFTSIKVHTAKCSECDQRNQETMVRCPGCTFQLCKLCRDRREAAGRTLAHGSMMTPRIATPGAGGSVVRRKPVSSAKKDGSNDAQQRAVKDRNKDEAKRVDKERGKVEGKVDVEEVKGTKRMAKPVPKPKPKPKPKVRGVTPSDDLLDDDSALDPGSPTASKRRRTLTSKAGCTPGTPSPFLEATSAKNSRVRDKAYGKMTMDELLVHHGVNTSQSPYKAHLLSRHEHVVSDPVIEIPEIVKRRFKPRRTAEEIQQSIQNKVRKKMGLMKSTEEDGGSE